ncbi:MAG: hypothetical protein FJ295_15920 [Planctomycetes bacterium]|nr:hypothetical protein [Planctomycetota bacterium]
MSIPAPPRAVRFSISELLISIAAVSCVLSGFSIYGLLGASLVSLFFGVLLIIRGRRRGRPWTTGTGIIISVLSFCAVGVVMGGWLFFGIGPIHSAASHPLEFKKMVQIADADTSDVKIYAHGEFIDREYVWRLTLTSDQLDRVIADCGMVAIPTDSVPQTFWWAFPRNWRPTPNEQSLFFATPGFPALSRGPDGDYYFAMYDRRTKRLYVWCKSNF